jgi:hypothetical protein
LKYKKHIFFTLISLVIVDSFRWLSYGGFLNVDSSTYIASFLTYISIFFLIKIALNSDWKKNTPMSIQNLLKFWIGLNVLNFVRSFFLAEDYWDYKYIFFNAVTFSFISLVFFIGNNLQKAVIVFEFAFKYLFPFGFLLIPLTLATNEELYSRIMIPISLFILFIPSVKFKNKVLIILVAVISILLVFSFRSNIIKIAFSTVLVLVYYFNVNYRFLRILNISLFAIPIVLFILAVSGSFNIFTDFSENRDFQIETKADSAETLADDSRTFLYVEVLQSITNQGNFFIGSGYAGGYESIVIEVSEGTTHNKRYDCEVGILNILMQSGLSGVLLYFLLLFKVSFMAINHSSNRLAKILGLYISFRWLLSFVEEFTQYDLNFYFFWLAIGLASSNDFRSMNDKEITTWIRGVYKKKLLFPRKIEYKNATNNNLKI